MIKECRPLYVFTDGSVNTKTKTGYGAFLLTFDLNAPIDSLKNTIKVKRFEQTSSTKLELQTLLWSMNEALLMTDESDFTVTFYSDSQNIISLLSRRDRLEKNNYYSYTFIAYS